MLSLDVGFSLNRSTIADTWPFRAKYYRNGRPVRESRGTDKESEARNFLRQKEGDLAAGRPVIPHADRIRFEELAEDLLTDYRVNGKRSLDRASET
jgi:hypothetical protein